jgi:hypothetical protein
MLISAVKHKIDQILITFCGIAALFTTIYQKVYSIFGFGISGVAQPFVA